MDHVPIEMMQPTAIEVLGEQPDGPSELELKRIVASIFKGYPTVAEAYLLRVRYSGNATGCHMGGPIDHKYRYSFNQRGIDCMMVRMIYFVQDVSNERGAFSVVPGTHKSNYGSPYRCGPDEEPGEATCGRKRGGRGDSDA